MRRVVHHVTMKWCGLNTTSVLQFTAIHKYTRNKLLHTRKTAVHFTCVSQLTVVGPKTEGHKLCNGLMVRTLPVQWALKWYKNKGRGQFCATLLPQPLLPLWWIHRPAVVELYTVLSKKRWMLLILALKIDGKISCV